MNARRGLGRLAVVVAIAAAAGACAAKRARTLRATSAPADAAAETPAGADDMGGDAAAGPDRFVEPMDELASLEEALYDNEATLRAAGVKLEFAPPDERETQEGAVELGAVDKCDRICTIATAVCDLESKICDLADRHAGDARYEKACARVQSDCERATEACDACK